MNPREGVCNRLYQKIMKITSQREREFNSMSHHNLMQKFVPLPQAMKILDATAAVDKEWEKLGKLPAWQLNNAQNKKGVILEAQKREKNSPFCYADGHLSSQKCGV